MAAGLLVRFRPNGPWRAGPDSGRRDRVDLIYHSDSLYSAVTSAMGRLGMLDEWIAATAANESGNSGVRFSSCYPSHKGTLFIVPPQSHWPPPESAKVRFKRARFVPLKLVRDLLSDKPIEEDHWHADGESECLIPLERRYTGGPMRKAMRTSAAVDRLDCGRVEPHATACLEFAPDAGLWMVVAFSGDDAKARWSGPVQGALRLLADSGFGGERSRGWGRTEMPEFTEGDLPGMLWKARQETEAVEDAPPQEQAYWLLSAYIPAESDTVDWKRGSYGTFERSGRIESATSWGGGLKLTSPMVTEGSVLFADSEPRGVAKNVAPAGCPHPVFRAGFALTIPIPWRRAL